MNIQPCFMCGDHDHYDYSPLGLYVCYECIISKPLIDDAIEGHVAQLLEELDVETCPVCEAKDDFCENCYSKGVVPVKRITLCDDMMSVDDSGEWTPMTEKGAI